MAAIVLPPTCNMYTVSLADNLLVERIAEGLQGLSVEGAVPGVRVGDLRSPQGCLVTGCCQVKQPHSDAKDRELSDGRERSISLLTVHRCGRKVPQGRCGGFELLRFLHPPSVTVRGGTNFTSYVLLGRCKGCEQDCGGSKTCYRELSLM